MPPATKALSPRRAARPTAPHSLRIEHENLDDKIYARLKALIAERRMLPGERILQDRLAREMGVSRTPLVNALKRLGARDVYCCASHALLSGPAVERLRASPIEEVTVTNTIRIPDERLFEKLKVLSIASLMAKAIGYEHSNQSVSSLFD